MTMRPRVRRRSWAPLVDVSQLFHLLVAEATSRANLAHPTCSWLLVPLQFPMSAQQILTSGSQSALATASSDAFQIRACSLLWPAPRRCRGFPRCPFRVCDGFRRPTPVFCQSPDCSRAERPQPCSLTVCSSVCESLHNQQPYTNCVWFFCKCAPGFRARINSPNGNTGSAYVLSMIFECDVVRVSALT